MKRSRPTNSLASKVLDIHLSWLPVVDFAAVRNTGYAHAIGQVVNEVDYAPVPYSYAPLVLTFKFLASCGARIFRQRQNPAVNAAKDGIVEGVEFFLDRRFDDNGVVSHATGCASSG